MDAISKLLISKLTSMFSEDDIDKVRQVFTGLQGAAHHIDEMNHRSIFMSEEIEVVKTDVAELKESVKNLTELVRNLIPEKRTEVRTPPRVKGE